MPCSKLWISLMQIDYGLATFDELAPWLDDARREGAHIDTTLKSRWTLLQAQFGTHLLGFVGLLHISPRYATIRGWYVIPGYRGSGLGTRLVEAAIDEASRQGAEQISIRTNRTHILERLGFDWTGYQREGGNQEEHWILPLPQQVLL